LYAIGVNALSVECAARLVEHISVCAPSVVEASSGMKACAMRHTPSRLVSSTRDQSVSATMPIGRFDGGAGEWR
tara:strand:+ start:348 stop:569 length:222 start_codon:yes stop_codon:yes gene_type:complete